MAEPPRTTMGSRDPRSAAQRFVRADQQYRSLGKVERLGVRKHVGERPHDIAERLHGKKGDRYELNNDAPRPQTLPDAAIEVGCIETGDRRTKDLAEFQ